MSTKRAWRIARLSTSGILLATILVIVARGGVLPIEINLATGDEDVSVTGAAGGDHSGFGLTAGDVNGDGRSDLVVLSYGAAPLGGTRLGEIDVVWGSTFPLAGDISLSQSSSLFSRIYGSTTQSYSSVISGGDFNNDGKFDIIWGQPFGPSPDFTSTDGIAYIIPGTSDFPAALDLGSNPPQLITLWGGPWDGGLGVAGCGCDLNGDEFDEIVISAPWYSEAEVFVVWGGTSFLATYNMGSPPSGVTTISETRSNTALGWGLDCGDFDDDGFEDLVMSAPGLSPPYTYGAVTILFGQAVFPSTVSLPNPAFRTKRIKKAPTIGAAVATGDFDGNGHLDLAAADPGADPFGCFDCGEVYVVLDPVQLPDSIWLDQADPIRLVGAGSNTTHGIRLRAGDITGDDRDELLVVSKGDNAPTSVDRTFIVYGAQTLDDTLHLGTDTTVTRVDGPAHNADLGRGLTIADFSGDGIGDVAVGAHRFQNNAGRSYIIFGISNVTSANPSDLAFLMRQNYPNPFNPATSIPYSISERARVRMQLFDVTGKLVSTLVDSELNPGEYVARWDGRDRHGKDVASGVYFCRLTTSERSLTMKIVLVR